MHTDKEIVIRRYFQELFNQGKVALVAELLDPDYVNHSTASPPQSRGPDGVVEVVRALRRAFPDLEYEILDLVEETDKVKPAANSGWPPGGRA